MRYNFLVFILISFVATTEDKNEEKSILEELSEFERNSIIENLVDPSSYNKKMRAAIGTNFQSPVNTHK